VPTLRVEHLVPDYEAWKKAFDRDPVARERRGVRRYRISRSIDDQSYVLIDLEFDRVGDAQEFLVALRDLWSRADLVHDPHVRITEEVESRSY
jgi:hypothetical protein